MSYTNETAHYGIPLPLGSDLTTPMDYNTCAEAIDADLFTAKGTAQTANTNANSALDAVNNITNNVIGGANGIDARLTAVEGTTSTQGTAITNLGLKVDDVKADALDMICAVDEGTAQVASVEVLEGNYFRYNDVLYIATTDIAIGDTIVPNTNCKASNVATELETVESDIATAKANITNAQTDIGNLQTAVNSKVSVGYGLTKASVISGSTGVFSIQWNVSETVCTALQISATAIERYDSTDGGQTWTLVWSK